MSSPKVVDRPRLSINDKDLGTAHYDCNGEYIYVLVTAPSYPQRTAFKLLGEVSKLVSDKYGSRLSEARADGLSSGWKKFLQPLATKYDDLSQVEKVFAVQQQVEEVKGVVNENIQQLLKAQDSLDNLQDKSEVLKNEARVFNKQAGDLASAMKWRSRKILLIIICVLIAMVAWVLVPIAMFLFVAIFVTTGFGPIILTYAGVVATQILAQIGLDSGSSSG